MNTLCNITKKKDFRNKHRLINFQLENITRTAKKLQPNLANLITLPNEYPYTYEFPNSFKNYK